MDPCPAELSLTVASRHQADGATRQDLSIHRRTLCPFPQTLLRRYQKGTVLPLELDGNFNYTSSDRVLALTFEWTKPFWVHMDDVLGYFGCNQPNRPLRVYRSFSTFFSTLIVVHFSMIEIDKQFVLNSDFNQIISFFLAKVPVGESMSRKKSCLIFCLCRLVMQEKRGAWSRADVEKKYLYLNFMKISIDSSI